MTTTLVRESAKIIQFPVHSRTASGERGEGAVVSMAAFAAAKAVKASRIAAPALPAVSIGTAWYHDEAILEDRVRKN